MASGYTPVLRIPRSPFRGRPHGTCPSIEDRWWITAFGKLSLKVSTIIGPPTSTPSPSAVSCPPISGRFTLKSRGNSASIPGCRSIGKLISSLSYGGGCWMPPFRSALPMGMGFPMPRKSLGWNWPWERWTRNVCWRTSWSSWTLACPPFRWIPNCCSASTTVRGC